MRGYKSVLVVRYPRKLTIMHAQQTLPYITPLPNALGCGIIISSSTPISNNLHNNLLNFIHTYEATLSRFQKNSLVSRIASGSQANTVTFPDWCIPLFEIYDTLFDATRGVFDACVGADLVALGYGQSLNNTDLYEHDYDRITQTQSPKFIHKTQWRNIARNGSQLAVKQAVQLDFGAAGKGYCVDLLVNILAQHIHQPTNILINAAGDIRYVHIPAQEHINQTHSQHNTIHIALENPNNTSQAVGIADCSYGAFCASSPAQRHWRTASKHYDVHHLINALDGKPARQFAASWTYIPESSAPATLYPTAWADALATALFINGIGGLEEIMTKLNLSCALLDTQQHAQVSQNFPATLFTNARS